MKQNQKGFTLIELLVVIAIIGLLSTLAVVALNSARAKSRDARRISDVKQMQTALEMYFNDVGLYPNAGGADLTPGAAGSVVICNPGGYTTTCASTDTTFMAVVPENPTPTNDGPCPAAGYSYNSLDGSTYRIMYCVGADAGSIKAGTNIACENGITGCSTP